MTANTLAGKEQAAKARDVHVDVYAYREGEDILFAQAWKLDGDKERKKGHIKIGEGQGDVPISFQLHNRTGLDLAFLPVDDGKQEGPFWCAMHDCPTAWGNGDGQIKSIEILPNDVLRVVDANSGEPCTLHYALRFREPKLASPTYEFDPDIRNGGGGFGSGPG